MFAAERWVGFGRVPAGFGRREWRRRWHAGAAIRHGAIDGAATATATTTAAAASIAAAGNGGFARQLRI